MTASVENTTTEPPRVRGRRPPRIVFVLAALALLGIVLYAWTDWAGDDGSEVAVDRHISAVPEVDVTAPSLGIALEPAEGEGLRVADVAPSSAAARAGLMLGDVIMSVNGERVASEAQSGAALPQLDAGEVVELVVSRGDRTLALEVVPARRDVSQPPTESREDRWREGVIGRWKTYHKGWRYMTVNPDGTATVEANLNDYAWHEKLLVGSDRVTFHVEWTIDDGRLHFETVGGEPEASVKVITTMHGDAKSFPIVHVRDDEFRYKSDKPEDPDFVWERVAPPAIENRG